MQKKTVPDSRKRNSSDPGSRKDENSEYGHGKDTNPKFRKIEEIKSRNLGARKNRKSSSRSPKADESVTAAPEGPKLETEDVELDKRRQNLTGLFQKLFNVNKTVKNFEYNVQFKRDMTVTQQKGRRMPIHIQKSKMRSASLSKKASRRSLRKPGKSR